MVTPSAPSTARGERTRRLLIEAARVRFARDGHRGTSVAVVSRDAGLGSTTAFVHFDNKEALFFAAVDDDLGAILGAEAAVESGPEIGIADADQLCRCPGRTPF